MMKKITWGVLSTARIGIKRVIPAMQRCQYAQISAIASRSLDAAEAAAESLGLPKAYGSYDALLADAEIDAVYIPLPNHLHVEWAAKALRAGKHVLCEKPIALNADEAAALMEEAQRHPELHVMEAFMYRFHSQWPQVKEMLASGTIGELRSIRSSFSYYNVDPVDIRNQPEIGGGGLLDIGCYCISVSRFLFEAEPERVAGSIDFDPKMRIDRLASGILHFSNGIASFTCATQLAGENRVIIHGTTGRLEVLTPFTPRADQACRIWHYSAAAEREIVVEPCDHYTVQGDLFSQAILNKTATPMPLADAVANMRVIDAVFASHQRGEWIKI